MTLNINKKQFLSHITGLLIILMAFSDITSSRAIISTCAILSIIIFIFYFPIENRRLFSAASLFILFLLVMSVVNLLFTENGFGGTLTLMGNLLLTLVYLQSDKKKLTPWIILFYLIGVGFISYSLFVLKLTANEIYVGLSRNHAGFAVVFYTIFLTFHLKITHKLYPVLPAIISLVLSIFLIGRTSMIVSVMLLAVVFYYKFQDKKVIRFAILGCVLLIGSYLYLTFQSVLFEETNLNQGLDTPRWELWQIYIEHINPINFFTGLDVSNLPMYDYFSGNPHNSFLKFHSRVGFGCVVLIILFFVSLYQYLKTGQNYVFWLLLLLTIRAFFDSDILIGNFDFVFFIVTFYWTTNHQYDT